MSDAQKLSPATGCPIADHQNSFTTRPLEPLNSIFQDGKYSSSMPVFAIHPIDLGGVMFTPIVTSTIPLHGEDQLISQARPRQLQTIEWAILGILLVGGKVLSNHLVTLLLMQQFGR